MKFLCRTAVFFTLLFLTITCKKENECQNAIHPLSQLFSILSNDPKYEDRVTYDSEVHEYNFKLSRNGSMCSIGYQSHPSVAVYLIEVIDQQGEVIYQDNLSFSETTLEYIPISPMPLQAGTAYTLRRSCLQYAWITETIGRILKEENNLIEMDTLTLPLGDDLITITDVDFYGHGDPPNNAIPFIDFGFIE